MSMKRKQRKKCQRKSKKTTNTVLRKDNSGVKAVFPEPSITGSTIGKLLNVVKRGKSGKKLHRHVNMNATINSGLMPSKLSQQPLDAESVSRQKCSPCKMLQTIFVSRESKTERAYVTWGAWSSKKYIFMNTQKHIDNLGVYYISTVRRKFRYVTLWVAEHW